MSVHKTIGLVGCGLWGLNILRDLVDLDASVIVADISETRRRNAIENGALNAVEKIDEIGKVDGLIVATPAVTHADVIEQFLNRGVPIFVEKPFTTDAVAAHRLNDTAGDRIFLMHTWRYHHGIRMLGEIARSNELGQVTLLRTVRTNWTSPRKDTDTIWTMAPHDLSIAIEILGAIPLPISATAEQVSGKAVGMIATLGENPGFIFEISNRYREKRREVRLHCRDGIAVLPADDCGYIEIIRESDADTMDAVIERRFFQNEKPLRNELKVILGYLQGGPPPLDSAREGLEVVRAIVELRRLAGIA